MIPFKELVPPKRRERVMRFSADVLANSRVKKCVLLSLRREGEALVPAAGAERIATLRHTYEALFYAGGAVFARRAGAVDMFPGGQTFSLGEHVPLDAAAFAAYQGPLQYYLPASDRVFRLYGTSYDVLADAQGGTCIAVHRERLFLGKGCRLAYSAPLSSSKWDPAEEETGVIDFSPEDGDVLALASFDGKLYVFRENAVLALRADANGLNFRFDRVEFGGRPLPGTVRCTGAGIVFQTERGLAYFTGSTCRIVRPVCMAELGTETAAWEGRYYALAQNGGKNCIYVYDPSADEEYLLDVPATHLAGGSEGVYFVHGTVLYRLTHAGYPLDGGEGAVEMELEAGSENGGKRYLAAITVLGVGNFTAEFTADGRTQTVALQAGRRTRVMRLLRTDVLKCTLKTGDADAAVRAVELHFEEDAQ